MAAAPAYASTPVLWTGLVPGTADASFTAPSTVTILGTAGASGTKITEVNLVPVGTVVAGLVNLFTYDGTTYHLWDSYLIAAGTVNTTTQPVRQVFVYDNLVLPGNSWSLRITNTVAGNVSLINVNAVGASL